MPLLVRVLPLKHAAHGYLRDLSAPSRVDATEGLPEGSSCRIAAAERV